MESPFHGVLEGAGVVCIFCGATRESDPQREFVTDHVRAICSTCVDLAQSIVRNEQFRHTIERLSMYK